VSTALHLTAKSSLFDTDCLVTRGGTPFTIQLDNADASALHNVAIFDQGLSEMFFRGKIVKGIATITYHVQALKPGTYLYHCEIHPNAMHGTLTVEA
jgi:plastocyanin